MKAISYLLFTTVLLIDISYAGTIVEATSKCPSHEILFPLESKKNLNLIANKGQKELLSSYDLAPIISFEHNNAEIIISKRFSRPDKDRFHVIAYIKIDGVVYPRIFYHSSSHGTFRVIDGVLGGWYSKGPGQAFISIPFKITKFLLNGCVEDGPKRYKKELEGLLALSDDHLYYFNNHDVFKEDVTYGLEDISLPLVLDGNGSEFRNPNDLVIKSGYEPNFNNLITTFNAETKAAGPVNVFIYRSINELLEYMVMKGADNKIWIAEINAFGEDINKFGIAMKQMDLGDLLQPRWEYPNEIAMNYKSPVVSPFRPKYKSNWNYLREVSTIQSWYKSRELDVPGKEYFVSYDTLTGN